MRSISIMPSNDMAGNVKRCVPLPHSKENVRRTSYPRKTVSACDTLQIGRKTDFELEGINKIHPFPE